MSAAFVYRDRFSQHGCCSVVAPSVTENQNNVDYKSQYLLKQKSFQEGDSDGEDRNPSETKEPRATEDKAAAGCLLAGIPLGVDHHVNR